MLYCPGKGQELLSALGVNLECHASSIFLVLKPPLSIIDALSKSIAWLDFDNASIIDKGGHKVTNFTCMLGCIRAFVVIETNNASLCSEKRTTLLESFLKHI